jgi:hypothetical protein
MERCASVRSDLGVHLNQTGGRSSGVELQPSKLAVASSNLVARSIIAPARPGLAKTSPFPVGLLDPERFKFARRDKAIKALSSGLVLHPPKPRSAKTDRSTRGTSPFPVDLFVPGTRCILEQRVPTIKLQRIGNTSSGLNWTRPEAPSINMRARMFSYPVLRDFLGAHVAQLAEHVLGKDEVTRSIRVVGSRIAQGSDFPCACSI